MGEAMCPDCGGEGKVGESVGGGDISYSKCERCKGTGVVETEASEYRVRVSFKTTIAVEDVDMPLDELLDDIEETVKDALEGEGLEVEGLEVTSLGAEDE